MNDNLGAFDNIRIEITEDFTPLAHLYNACGLEVKPDAKMPDGTLRLWRCFDANGKLLAAATLQKFEASFVLKHLAVDEAARGLGIGAHMLKIVEETAASLGAKELWLVGKVPEFYKKYNWEVVAPKDAPPISNCQTCPQFNTNCWPSIMRKSRLA
ncbi:MAG: GNAT family N-acetyltransferase [Firmicutes bacterium]|nr:GNAT family N-acetyltransferase [Bacillota bacterium]